MSRRLIIGDIHGCFDELRALLDLAGLGIGDEIIALGDIVDRGPASPAVLDFFHSQPNAKSLMGNHERKHVRSFRGELKPALSQVITRSQLGETRYPAECGFVASFPRFLELPDALLLHGFLEPGIPLDQQRDTVVIGTLSGEFYLRKKYTKPWYELYNGAKPLIVGHHDYLGTGQPLIYKNLVFCIDTGCCHGKALTGLVLPEFRIISVPSRRDYWAEVSVAFLDAHPDIRHKKDE